MKKSELIFGALLVPVDFLMILVAGIVAYFIRTSPLLIKWRPVLFSLNLPFSRFAVILIAAAIFILFVFALSGLYKIRASRRLFEEFSQIIISTSAAVLAIIVLLFLRSKEFESRFIVLATWILAILFIFIGRFFVKKLQRYMVGKYGTGSHNVLIIGGDGMSENIIREIINQPDLGYRIIRHFPELDIEKIKQAIKNPGIDTVILASPKYEREEILDILDFCEEYRVVFKFVPSLFQTMTTNIEIDTLGGVPLIEIKKTPLDGWGRILKRWVDVFASIIGLIILSPFFLIIAIIIKLHSKGPVFVRLPRVSGNHEFRLLKFRSMIAHDFDGSAASLRASLVTFNERTDGPLFKMKNDPRVTKFGRVLRKTRLDEFPQLINVLKGEMSLVGPRPHQPDEISQYKQHHKRVLLIKSGMTGLAQISGSSDLPFEEEVKLDTYYIENWSLKKDIYIMLKTILILFKDRSAC